jgi:hypothetical protein
MSFASLSSLTGSKDLDSLLFLKLKKGDLLNAMLINKKCYFLIKLNKFWWNKLATDFPNRSKFLVSDYHKNLYRNNPQKLYRKIDRKAIEISIFIDGGGIVRFERYDIRKAINGKAYTDDGVLIYSYNRNINWFDIYNNYNKEETFTLKELDEIAVLLKKLDFEEMKLLYGDIISIEFKNLSSYDFMWYGDFFKSIEHQKTPWLDKSYWDQFIPNYFSFPEFPLEHFSDTPSFDNNIMLANLSEQTISEIIKNFDVETQKSYFLDYDTNITVKSINKNKYTKNQFIEEITKHPFIYLYEYLAKVPIIKNEYYIGRYDEKFN